MAIELEYLQSLLSYDKETGIFTWIKNKGRKVVAGKKAGHIREDGYERIVIDGIGYMSHRLAFIIQGITISDEVDHIDCNPSNNKWDNLRLADRQLNSQNHRKSKNKHGLMGIYQEKSGKFRGQVRHEGKNVACGTYVIPEEAHAAYLDTKRHLHKGCTI